MSKVIGHESKHINIDIFREVWYFRIAKWMMAAKHEWMELWMKNLFLFVWYLIPLIISMSVNKHYRVIIVIVSNVHHTFTRLPIVMFMSWEGELCKEIFG